MNTKSDSEIKRQVLRELKWDSRIAWSEIGVEVFEGVVTLTGNVNSYATFGRTFDLFGDGSVRLAYTPGHSAGHQSVIARLSRRDFVIGGDAIYTYRQLEGAPLPPRPVDEHQFRRSLQELKLFRREYPHAVITPGHDTSFYEQLDPKYD